jgi:hypothetical protein
MNQNNSGDPLDTLLHQWADERTADSEHLAACPDTHSDLVFVGEMSYYEFS